MMSLLLDIKLPEVDSETCGCQDKFSVRIEKFNKNKQKDRLHTLNYKPKLYIK